MRRNVDDRIGKLLSLLDEGIAGLSHLGYADTAKILQIAKLDLKMKAHEISDQEIRTLCRLLGNQQNAKSARARVIDFPHKSAEQRRRLR